MPDLHPTHLVITLAPEPQDARDLYSEHRLVCAGCGRNNRQVPSWVLAGLCSECALRVESVTAAAPTATRRQPEQAVMFETARLPG
jgi:predicted amidophosphoribosyltransferase